MATKITSKATALGEFLLTSNKVCLKPDGTPRHGGNQRLQKIVGASIYYQSQDKKLWFFNVAKLRTMSVKQLNDLTAKVKKA